VSANGRATPRPRAVIFDLGATLVDWPDWEEDVERRWALSYDHLVAAVPDRAVPDRAAYVRAMRAAELAHWERVVAEQVGEPPEHVLRDGFRRLGGAPDEAQLLAALDGYARAVDGWAVVDPAARETLRLLRGAGYQLGLLSNTWWSAAWHDADLAAHGLADLLHTVVYTSGLPHSKPHPAVFLEAARRLAVEPSACVMVGDRLLDDIGGALAVGMRAVWKRTDKPWSRSGAIAAHIVPTATITGLAELSPLLEQWARAAG